MNAPTFAPGDRSVEIYYDHVEQDIRARIVRARNEGDEALAALLERCITAIEHERTRTEAEMQDMREQLVCADLELRQSEREIEKLSKDLEEAERQSRELAAELMLGKLEAPDQGAGEP